MFHSMVREPVCRFIVPPFTPLLDDLRPDTTPAAYGAVAMTQCRYCSALQMHPRAARHFSVTFGLALCTPLHSRKANRQKACCLGLVKVRTRNSPKLTNVLLHLMLVAHQFRISGALMQISDGIQISLHFAVLPGIVCAPLFRANSIQSPDILRQNVPRLTSDVSKPNVATPHPNVP